MRHFIYMILPLMLSGCLLESVAPLDRNLKPYGAHWIKEGMTRESRLNDFVMCGGGKDLREGYVDWLSSVPYETYSVGKTQHIRSIAACMKFKNYGWLDNCDERCLYP
ncbi:MAG: hypothetical protein K0U21_04630 [Proteobacteria bacterium]|nr:hypothetical protein [Pseudomonadota bacterium]